MNGSRVAIGPSIPIGAGRGGVVAFRMDFTGSPEERRAAAIEVLRWEYQDSPQHKARSSLIKFVDVSLVWNHFEPLSAREQRLIEDDGREVGSLGIKGPRESKERGAATSRFRMNGLGLV